jgi:hypothetical protein
MEIDASDCPSSGKGDLPDCDKPSLALNDLCEGGGELGTSNSLENCGTFDLYRLVVCLAPPASPPSPPMGCALCSNHYEGGRCLMLVDDDACPFSGLSSLQNCDKKSMSINDLCEGDGEIGTNTSADNCGNGFDVYRWVDCAAQPPSPPMTPPTCKDVDHTSYGISCLHSPQYCSVPENDFVRRQCPETCETCEEACSDKAQSCLTVTLGDTSNNTCDWVVSVNPGYCDQYPCVNRDCPASCGGQSSGTLDESSCLGATPVTKELRQRARRAMKRQTQTLPYPEAREAVDPEKEFLRVCLQEWCEDPRNSQDDEAPLCSKQQCKGCEECDAFRQPA